MSEYSPQGRTTHPLPQQCVCGLTFSSARGLCSVWFSWVGFAAAFAVNFIKVHNCMGLVALEIVLRFLWAQLELYRVPHHVAYTFNRAWGHTLFSPSPKSWHHKMSVTWRFSGLVHSALRSSIDWGGEGGGETSYLIIIGRHIDRSRTTAVYALSGRLIDLPVECQDDQQRHIERTACGKDLSR